MVFLQKIKGNEDTLVADFAKKFNKLRLTSKFFPRF